MRFFTLSAEPAGRLPRAVKIPESVAGLREELPRKPGNLYCSKRFNTSKCYLGCYSVLLLHRF